MIRHRWRTHIKNTESEAALLELVRQYLAEWTAQERDQLPSSAWPAPMETRKDLATWTFRLGELHAEFDSGSSQALARLQDLLLFFTQASVRMAQLANLAGSKSRETED